MANKPTVIPRQVGSGADKDRRAIPGDRANLNMYNRYNAASSYVPTLSRADTKRVDSICDPTEAPACYKKVY